MSNIDVVQVANAVMGSIIAISIAVVVRMMRSTDL